MATENSCVVTVREIAPPPIITPTIEVTLRLTREQLIQLKLLLGATAGAGDDLQPVFDGLVAFTDQKRLAMTGKWVSGAGVLLWQPKPNNKEV